MNSNDNSDIEWSLLLIAAVYCHETPAVMEMSMCRLQIVYSAKSTSTPCTAIAKVNSLQIVNVQFKFTVKHFKCNPVYNAAEPIMFLTKAQAEYEGRASATGWATPLKGWPQKPEEHGLNHTSIHTCA